MMKMENKISQIKSSVENLTVEWMLLNMSYMKI